MHKMVVMAKAAEGRKDELGRWYDERHIDDLLAVPGLVSAERHDLILLKHPDGLPQWDFMLIYEFEGNPMDVLRTMPPMGSEALPTSDALESVSTLSVLAMSHGRRDAAS
jgi:hypothetical protein